MLSRVLEPEVMDSTDEARDYDEMDHSAVNRVFAADFFSAFPAFQNPVLDVGTGTAQIPIQMCRLSPTIHFVAIDLAESMLELAARNVAIVRRYFQAGATWTWTVGWACCAVQKITERVVKILPRLANWSLARQSGGSARRNAADHA